MENPLAGAARNGPSEVAMVEVGPFPLTLRDVFTNTHVVDVTPATKVFEVKELLRDAKKVQAEAELSSAREHLVQIESEVSRAQESAQAAQLAALAAEKAAAAEQIARFEEQARELESLDYLDALVLHSQEPLDDDGTVGSHGLSRETTVGISNKDAAQGRARREIREAEAATAVAAYEARRARQMKALVACAGLVLVSLIMLLFGVAGMLIEALGCALGYALWRLPDDKAGKVMGLLLLVASMVCISMLIHAWARSDYDAASGRSLLFMTWTWLLPMIGCALGGCCCCHQTICSAVARNRNWRAGVGVLLAQLVMVGVYFAAGCGGLDCGALGCIGGLSGLSAQCVIPDDGWTLGDMIMRSEYNGALVQAVVYTGVNTMLSWELQRTLCAAAGRATPGSSATGVIFGYDLDSDSDSDSDWMRGGAASQRRYDYQDKYCAYSPSNNHVVTDRCSWYNQGFAHVSGSLAGSRNNEPTCACAGVSNTNSGGASCGSLRAVDFMHKHGVKHGQAPAGVDCSAGCFWCYVQPGVCSDGQISQQVANYSFSHLACAGGVGSMCCSDDCGCQVRVEGSATGCAEATDGCGKCQRGAHVTLRSGDAVFCSA
jgi:hypothetical protein